MVAGVNMLCCEGVEDDDRFVGEGGFGGGFSCAVVGITPEK